jgi:hypothetical protein
MNRLLQWFTYADLSEEEKAVAQKCAALATAMDGTLAEGAEKTAGLRKLLEAKDCFVRAVIEGQNVTPVQKSRS